jgi:hypothetical protein
MLRGSYGTVRLTTSHSHTTSHHTSPRTQVVATLVERKWSPFADLAGIIAPPPVIASPLPVPPPRPLLPPPALAVTPAAAAQPAGPVLLLLPPSLPPVGLPQAPTARPPSGGASPRASLGIASTPDPSSPRGLPAAPTHDHAALRTAFRGASGGVSPPPGPYGGLAMLPHAGAAAPPPPGRSDSLPIPARGAGGGAVAVTVGSRPRSFERFPAIVEESTATTTSVSTRRGSHGEEPGEAGAEGAQRSSAGSAGTGPAGEPDRSMVGRRSGRAVVMFTSGAGCGDVYERAVNIMFSGARKHHHGRQLCRKRLGGGEQGNGRGGYGKPGRGGCLVARASAAAAVASVAAHAAALCHGPGRQA